MSFDVVVVGGGIIGCTSAYYLAKKGLKVALVEQGKLTGGTSANNFSWVNGTSKTSDAAYHRLNAIGVDMYDALAEEFGADVIGMNPCGAISFANGSDPAPFDAQNKQAQILEGLGYECKSVGMNALIALEPNINWPEASEGLLSPTDKCLNAPVFANFMAAQVKRLGGKVIEDCAAVALEADDDGVVTGLTTEQGMLKTAKVVVATGPNTPEVLAELTGFEGFASRFPVGKVPGLLVTTPPVEPGLLRHLIYTDCGGEFHMFPDFNGGIRIGSDDTDGKIIDDQSPENLRNLARGLLKRVQDLLPGFAGEECLDECKLAIGIRAYPEDGHSIVGAFPAAEGLYLIATHSGITLAPALGSMMAEMVADGVVPEVLVPFGVKRLKGF